MKTFIWQGLVNGKKESGTLTAPDKITATLLLEDKQITAIQVTPFKKITLKKSDHFMLLAELYNLLNADISLLAALQIITSTHQKFFLLCKKIEEQLKSGQSLAKALEVCQLYNVTIYTLIHLGEQTGQLTTILKKIIEQYKQESAVLKNIKKALLYPTFVLVTTLAVLLAMLLFVIPKFSSLFQQFHSTLPLFTRVMIALSGNLKSHGGILLIIIALLIGVLILTSHCYKSLLMEYLLHIPYLKTVLLDSLCARIFFLFHTCLTSGLSLHEALTLVIPTIPFKRYQHALAHITAQLKMGVSFSQSLDPRLFPENIRQWMIIAENSGTLDNTCKVISEHYSNILNEKSEKISLLIEPIIMVVLGLCIGGIVVAVYLPLFQIGLAI